MEHDELEQREAIIATVEEMKSDPRLADAKFQYALTRIGEMLEIK